MMRMQKIIHKDCEDGDFYHDDEQLYHDEDDLYHDDENLYHDDDDDDICIYILYGHRL